MTSHLVPLEAVLSVFRDGDEVGWDDEFDFLWDNQPKYMDSLMTSIQETGIRRPILIGNDGRVWDGHHRLAVAYTLGLPTVPITFSGEEEDD